MFSALGSFERMVAVVVAVTLLCSFGLHSIQVEHEHPSTPHAHTHLHADAEKTDQTTLVFMFLADEMHVSDKKWLLLAIFTLAILLPSVASWQDYLLHIRQSIRRSLSHHSETYSFLVRLYSVGILNPKLY